VYFLILASSVLQENKILQVMQKEAEKWLQKKKEPFYKLSEAEKDRIRGTAAREIRRQRYAAT
jgi:hypothetical protein